MERDEFALVWKALADPTRRTILDLLRERPHTTGELSAAFEVSRYAVMKHLNVLVEAELVAVRREGRERWNHLNSIPLQRVYERWLKPYEAEWAGSLLGLKRRSEEIAESVFTGGSMDMAEQTQEMTMGTLRVAQDIFIEANAAQVFDALTEPDAWWSHSFAESPRGIYLEPHVGGRFWEEIGDDGEGALYATVTYVKRGEKLQMRGPLGMRGAVSGMITFELEAQDEGTLLKLTHHAVGEISEDLKMSYTEGWKELLGDHLKAFAEQGVRLERG